MASPGGRSNLVFHGVLLWFLLLIVAALLVAARREVPPLWAVSAVGLIALIMPASLILAWRVGAPGGGPLSDDSLRELLAAIRRQSDEAGLSEAAKRVIHRKRERELLCAAIEQDINAGDWDAAMVLVKELAERFGYRADAEQFRARIERARAQTLDRKVVEALALLDDLIRRRQWTEAYAEAARIQRLYPDSPRVDRLRERVDSERAAYRADLEGRFLRAAEGGEVDQAMELLRELDLYLTPSEARPFQETARAVIEKMRESLGARFRSAVQQHQWDDAVIIGEQITSQFPNTRMAQEVRDLMPMVRERAEQVERSAAKG